MERPAPSVRTRDAVGDHRPDGPACRRLVEAVGVDDPVVDSRPPREGERIHAVVTRDGDGLARCGVVVDVRDQDRDLRLPALHPSTRQGPCRRLSGRLEQVEPEGLHHRVDEREQDGGRSDGDHRHRACARLANKPPRRRGEHDAPHGETAAQVVVPHRRGDPQEQHDRRGGEHERNPGQRRPAHAVDDKDERHDGHHEPDRPVPRLALRRERRVAARAQGRRRRIADELPAVPVDAVEHAFRRKHQQGERRQSGSDDGQGEPAQSDAHHRHESCSQEVEESVVPNRTGELERLDRVARESRSDRLDAVAAADPASLPAEQPVALREIDGIPRSAHQDRDEAARQGERQTPPSVGEHRDRKKHGERQEPGDLRADEERDGQASEHRFVRLSPQREVRRRRDERGHEQVVHGSRGLKRDDRESCEQQGAEQRSPASEADPERDAVDREHRGEKRREVDERHPPHRAGQQHRRSLEDLGIRREVVDPQVGRIPDLTDRSLLDPEQRPPEVVREAVDVVRRREERQSGEVGELHRHDGPENDENRVPEELAQRLASPELRPGGPDDRQRGDNGGGNPSEHGEKPVALVRVEDRERMADRDGLGEGENADREDERDEAFEPQEDGGSRRRDEDEEEAGCEEDHDRCARRRCVRSADATARSRRHREHGLPHTRPASLFEAASDWNDRPVPGTDECAARRAHPQQPHAHDPCDEPRRVDVTNGERLETGGMQPVVQRVGRVAAVVADLAVEARHRERERRGEDDHPAVPPHKAACAPEGADVVLGRARGR